MTCDVNGAAFRGLDLEDLRRWIGRTETARDLVTARIVRELRATLDLETSDAETPPLGLHWCLAPPAARTADLDPDGHPARGGFLPPVPLPRRMWAGGRLELHDSLQVGDAVDRRSTIRDVSLKSGRAGVLCFVTVDHVISTARGLAVAERQDIVYRAAAGSGAPPPDAGAPLVEGAWRVRQLATSVLLFRYSALTFNGHRIHYDRAYATEEEGYAGLVVHGPLQATLLLNFALAIRKGVPPKRFEFRGVRPLIGGANFSLNADTVEGGLDLWCAADGCGPSMTAQARD